MSIKKHLLVALFYFILAASIGFILRFFTISPIDVPYKYLVHTHSHIALLGWVYLALTSLIYGVYLNKASQIKRYKRIFWFTQLTLVGMLVSFPIQGYALFSIIFSTLFLLVSYWFFGFFLRYSDPELRNTPAYRCIRTALWYMVISSIGPWVLGIIMNTLGGYIYLVSIGHLFLSAFSIQWLDDDGPSRTLSFCKEQKWKKYNKATIQRNFLECERWNFTEFSFIHTMD